MTDPFPAGPRPAGRPPLPGFPAGAGRPPGQLPQLPGQHPPLPYPPARPAGWTGFQDARADLRGGLVTAAVLALSGVPAALLWLWLAPRASFSVVEGDVVPIGTPPSSELFVADDGVYVLVLAGLGLLAGAAVWLRRRARGVVALAALAAGMVAASLVAWQVGELLAPGPTDEQLSRVGGTVTTGVELAAVAAVAVGPFLAVLTYLVASTLTARDDLGREDEPATDRGGLPGVPVRTDPAPEAAPGAAPR